MHGALHELPWQSKGANEQTVSGKCLGQAVREDRVSLFIHTECLAAVISLLIISCGLRGAHSHGITSLVALWPSCSFKGWAFLWVWRDQAISTRLLCPVSQRDAWSAALSAGRAPEDFRRPQCRAVGDWDEESQCSCLLLLGV